MLVYGNESWYSAEAVAIPGSVETSVCSTNLPLKGLHLGTVSPNPFRAWTRLLYSLPSEGAVCLEVYDIVGRCVATLVDRFEGKGDHTQVWDGRDTNGREVASGVYFCRLTWNGESETRRMLLVR